MARVQYKLVYSALKKVAFAQSDLELVEGRNCVVDIKGDRFLAKVHHTKDTTPKDTASNSVIRLADEADEIHYDLQIRRSFYYSTKANEFIRKNDLQCKVAYVEPTFDVRRIIFYFSAQSFMNLKSLIKEMSALTKAEVEFRQVEGRDKAKLVSDVGMCGLQTCCTRFLFEIPIISRKDVEGMWANEKDYLGVCGRIKCCSTFEKREKGEPGCGTGGCSTGGGCTTKDKSCEHK